MGPLATVGPFASYESLPRRKNTARAEAKTRTAKKGEIRWTITAIPLAKRRTDSRKVDLQLQRAGSLQKKLQKFKRKLPTSAARRWTISTNPGVVPRAPWTKLRRNCIQVESNSPAQRVRPLTKSRAWRTVPRTIFKPPQTISVRRTGRP